MVLILEKDIKYVPTKIPVEYQKKQETTRKGPIPKIDKEKCTKCQLCVVVCPHDSIEMKNEFPIIINDKCTGCLICLRECPWSAIKE